MGWGSLACFLVLSTAPGLQSGCANVTDSEQNDEEVDTAELALLTAPVPVNGATLVNVPLGGASYPAWQSKLDNPRFTGSFTLKSWESASVGGIGAGGVNYDLFDISARGTASATGSTFTLNAFPATNVSPLQVLTWTTRGIKLPRRLGSPPHDQLELELLYNDKSTSSNDLSLTSKAKVFLDSNVVLVPVHVIVLSTPGSPYFTGWVPQDEMRVIFDDETVADKHVNTTPTTNPDSVLYAWHDKGRDEPVVPLNTDPIWTQCDIQFRMKAFSSCEVPIEAMVPPANTECGDNPLRAQQGKVIDAVDACTAAMKKPGIRIIVTGQLEGPICSGVAGVTGPGENVSVVDQDALASAPNAIPHEIGHMLGLPDLDDQDTRLMYSYGGSTTLLQSNECTIARNFAQSKQFAWAGQ